VPTSSATALSSSSQPANGTGAFPSDDAVPVSGWVFAIAMLISMVAASDAILGADRVLAGESFNSTAPLFTERP
jgi:cell division protein FtsX